MLKSILAQQPAVAPLSVSWSAATAELAQRVRKLFATAIAKGLMLTQLEQPTKTSQFEHLRALTELHAPKPPLWVLFTDDDDLWSERRFSLYWDEARKAARSAPGANALLCRRKAMKRANPAAPAPAAEPDDAAGVRALLASRHVRLSDCTLPDGLDDDDFNMSEYFDAAVRYGVLAAFFARVPRFVTRHRLCDLAFCFLLQKDPSTVLFMPSDPDEFVYFYARGGKPQGASGVTASENDSALAQQAYSQAPEDVRRLFQREGGSTSLVVSFVACLRQGLEQELIQVRAFTAVAPAELVAQFCNHQARKNVQSFAIERPEMGRVPALVTWATALANGPLRDALLVRFEFEALVEQATMRVVRFVDLPEEEEETEQGQARPRPPRRTEAQILREECDVATGQVGPWKRK